MVIMMLANNIVSMPQNSPQSWAGRTKAMALKVSTSVRKCSTFSKVIKSFTGLAKECFGGNMQPIVRNQVDNILQVCEGISTIAAPCALISSTNTLVTNIKEMVHKKSAHTANKIMEFVASIFFFMSTVVSNIKLFFQVTFPVIAESPILGFFAQPLLMISSFLGIGSNSFRLHKLKDLQKKNQELLHRRLLWQKLVFEQQKPLDQRNASALHAEFNLLQKIAPNSVAVKKWASRLDPIQFDALVAEKKRKLHQKNPQADQMLQSIENWKLFYNIKNKAIDRTKTIALKGFYERKLTKLQRKMLEVPLGSKQHHFWQKKCSVLSEKISLFTEVCEKGAMPSKLQKMQKDKLRYIGNREKKWKSEKANAALYEVCLKETGAPLDATRFSLLIGNRVDIAKNREDNGKLDKKRSCLSLALSCSLVVLVALTLVGLVASVVTGGVVIPVAVTTALALVTASISLGKFLAGRYLWKDKKTPSLESALKKQLLAEERRKELPAPVGTKDAAAFSASEVGKSRSESSKSSKKGNSLKARAIKVKTVAEDLCNKVCDADKFTDVAASVTNIAQNFFSPTSPMGSKLPPLLSCFGIVNQVAKPCNLFLSIITFISDVKKMVHNKCERIADKVTDFVSSIFWLGEAAIGTMTVGVELFASAVSAIPILGILGNSLMSLAAGIGSIGNCLRLHRLRKESVDLKEKLLRRQLWQQLFTEQQKDVTQRDVKALQATWEQLNKKFANHRGTEKWKNRLDPRLFDELIRQKKSKLARKESQVTEIQESLESWKGLYDVKQKLVNFEKLESLKHFYANKLQRLEAKRLEPQAVSEKKSLDKKISALMKKIAILHSTNSKDLIRLQKKKARFIASREEKWKKEKDSAILYKDCLNSTVATPKQAQRVSCLLSHRLDEARIAKENNRLDQKRSWVTLAVNITFVAFAVLSLVGLTLSIASGGVAVLPIILMLASGLLVSSLVLSKYLLHTYLWKEKAAPVLEESFKRQLLAEALA